MKPSIVTLNAGLLLLLAACAPTARAGMVITANLPAGDAIVAIGGNQDGAATSGGAAPPGVLGPGQDYWYQPISATGNLLAYTIQPGTYQFRVIDQAAAASLFPSLAPDQLAAIGAGSWTYNSPWATDYLVFDGSAATDPAQHQLFSGAIVPGSAVPGSTGFNGGGHDTPAEATTRPSWTATPTRS